MKPLSEYYEPRVPIQKDIDALCDPKLDHARDRADINRILMNLVTKYAAEYLQVPPDDIGAIERRALEAVTLTPQDGLMRLVETVAKGSGKMKNGEGNLSKKDAFPVECLTDIRSTAAIMKEVIFGGKFELGGYGPYADNFIGADLGHGTGILTLGIHIAARRKEIRDIFVVGCDISDVAVQNSARTLATVSPEARIQVKQLDVTHPSIMWLFQGVALNYLVSETIGPGTPKIIKKDGNWALEEDYNIDVLRAIMTHSDFDPFAEVFLNTLQYRPELEFDVISGRTAMFPDIINGRFRPDNNKSTLSLRTGVTEDYVRLHEVGSEFSEFETLNVGTRWQGKEIEVTDEVKAEMAKLAERIARELDK